MNMRVINTLKKIELFFDSLTLFLQPTDLNWFLKAEALMIVAIENKDYM